MTAIVVAVILVMGVSLLKSDIGARKSYDAIHASVPCAHSVKVAVLPDKSGSVRANGVHQVKPEDITILNDLIVQCGGEVGVAVIGDASDRPLERWYVPAPEAMPNPPSQSETAINAAVAQSRYEQVLAARAERDRRRIETAETEFKSFMDKVTAMLLRPANERRSLLWDAISRADAFLAEEDGPQIRSELYMVIVSDGIATSGQPVPINSGATILLCYGRPSAGALQGLPLKRFESPSAAFRRIVQTEAPHAH